MNREDIALSNCEREPVHIPGRIQSFGALFGFDTKTMETVYRSGNLAELFPVIDREVLGNSFEDISDNRALVHSVRGALGLPTVNIQRERVGVHTIGDVSADVAVFVADEIGVVELEPLRNGTGKPDTPVSRIKTMLAGLDADTGVQSLLNSAVVSLRKLTGYDRVMGYKFLESGDGEVISEAKSISVEPYLGLRYPAFDIPPQVRKLAITMPFRAIHDINDDHVDLMSLDGQRPLDLSLSHLRGVSPIHVEYLKNMGVQATMNLSIIVRGELWGLFAFHHYRPYLLTPDQRSVCELFGHLLSLQIQQTVEQEAMQRRRRIDSTLQTLGDESTFGLVTILERFGTDLQEIVDADGVALVQGNEVHRLGEVPTSDDVVRQILMVSEENVFHLDSLNSTEMLADSDHTPSAGALVSALQPASRTYLIFFRNEIVSQIRWAGTKEKNIQYGPNGPRLHPRGSFEEYCESVSGRCRPWSRADVTAANSIRTILKGALQLQTDESAAELSQHRKQQDLLIAELNHRVRNILALVRSISRNTKETATSLKQYAEAFEQRIAALSAAHDLAGGSGLQWAPLRDLLRTELSAFSSGGIPVDISGPSIGLRADIAPMMALVIHELTTNAAKHGALSEHGKSLRVRWSRENGGLTLRWQEEVKHRLRPPVQQGFGLNLVRRAVPHECGGECETEFREDGLRVRFWLPSEAVRDVKISGGRKFVAPDASSQRLSGRRAIVLEDNVSLAMEMESLLQSMGFTEVLTFADLEKCLADVEGRKIDVAVLDIDLRGKTSFGVANALLDKNIPVIFASGYGSMFEIPDELTDVPRLTKPIRRETLLIALKNAVGEKE